MNSILVNTKIVKAFIIIPFLFITMYPLRSHAQITVPFFSNYDIADYYSSWDNSFIPSFTPTPLFSGTYSSSAGSAPYSFQWSLPASTFTSPFSYSTPSYQEYFISPYTSFYPSNEIPFLSPYVFPPAQYTVPSSIPWLTAGQVDIPVTEPEPQIIPVEIFIDSSKLRAIVDEKSIDGSIAITRINGPQDMNATLSIKLENLDKNILRNFTESITLYEGEYEYAFSLQSLPALADDAALVDYNLLYSLTWSNSLGGTKNTQSGKKSLLHAVELMEVQITGSDTIAEGSVPRYRALVLNPRDMAGYADAEISVYWEGDEGEEEILLYAGHTDASGTADIDLDLPDDLSHEGNLSFEILSLDGRRAQRIVETVKIERKVKVLLTTDKPRYQPGQSIHIRTLSIVDTIESRAAEANKPIVIEVEDSKGNKVFKKQLVTSDQGVAAAEFILADEINMGNYRIRAILGETTSEKTVIVEQYVLPKFDIIVTTNKNTYQPGEVVDGRIEALYFFGKPVAQGKVELSFKTFITGMEEFGFIEGRTDESGFFSFEQPLGKYFVGQPLEQGKGIVFVEATVTDTAEHEEKAYEQLIVAEDPFTISLLLEGDYLVPQMENRLYLITKNLNGIPIETQNSIFLSENMSAPFVTIATDETGIAEFSLIPSSDTMHLTVISRDREGTIAEKEFSFDTDKRSGGIIIRTDKSLYTVGESMTVTVLTSMLKTRAYLDFIKGGQLFLTEAIDIDNGTGQFILDLSEEFAGSLWIQGYFLSDSSDIIRDRKLVYVDSAKELLIDICFRHIDETSQPVGTAVCAPDIPVYRPRQEAWLDFQVSGDDTLPVALGLQIVDEAVFALQDMQPGLEKIYFMLEEEIAQPRFEIHGFTLPEIIIGTPDLEKDKAARVIFASVEDLPTPGISTNTYHTLLDRVKEKMSKRIEKDLNHNLAIIQKKKIYTQYDLHRAIAAGNGIDEEWIYDDPWDYPYTFTIQDYSTFTLSSSGPDMILNTKDDISLSAPLIVGFPSGAMIWGGGIKWGFAAVPNAAGGFGGGLGFAAPLSATPLLSETAGGMMPVTTVAQMAEDPLSSIMVREYFPETLFFEPALITDSEGNASVQVPLADSITSWRLSALASNVKGNLGSTSNKVRVFQEFFIDIDFPVQLTQNDEISVPIAVYNYLDTQQEVRVKVVPDPEDTWFKLLEESSEKSLTLGPGQVSVVYFKIIARTVGWHSFTVYGIGEQKQDAIRRQIEVIPDGKEHIESISDRLEDRLEHTIVIPHDAIDEASKILVKIYPGLFTQVVEGLDSMFRMPFGCFEQTSSVTYPNVLVLNYLRAVEQLTPETELKARQYINLGYQRLLSYEVEGGGFEWFGRPPAHKILTAFGLMEFFDMAKVHEVDPKVIKRTQEWLLKEQEADGRWEPSVGGIAEGVINKFRDEVLRTTAYITWALMETEYQGIQVQKAIDYLVENLVFENEDTYTLALCANALVAYQNVREDASLVGPVNDLLSYLYSVREEKNDEAYWCSESETITYSRGEYNCLETTALIGYSFLKARRYSGTVENILNYIIHNKDGFGTWGNTQATVGSLRLLALATTGQAEDINGTVVIIINGEEVSTLEITSQDSDVLRQIDLKTFTKEGDNRLTITKSGEGTPLYQIVGKYYLPWPEKEIIQEGPPLTIEIMYDKTDIHVSDMIECEVVIKNTIKDSTAKMVVVDLGIPPGFEVMVEGIDSALEDGIISKYEKVDRQIIIYLEKVVNGEPIRFSYQLRAKYPVKVQTPVSRVHEYYNPDRGSEKQPIEIRVQP
ncbi:MAG: alpha-2-macroglobulin family protein [bacterium]